MNRVDALVAEIAVDLINAIQSADHKPLQIKLRRNAQVQIHIESIMVCDERPRRGSPQNRMHHRCFHFHVAALVKKTPNFPNDFRARNENFSRAVIHNQVKITPPIALLDIRKPVPFLRQRQQRLAEQFELRYPHGQLIRLRSEQMPADADDVAQIEQLKQLELLRTHHVELHIELQARAVPQNVTESSLPVRPERDDAPRHSHVHMLRSQLLGSSLAEFLGHLPGRVCPFELVRIRRVSQRLNFGQFFAALLKLVERLKFQRRVLSGSRPAV